MLAVPCLARLLYLAIARRYATVSTLSGRLRGEASVGGRRLTTAGAVVPVLAILAGCSLPSDDVETPSLEAPGTVLTTVQPTRQDLTNQVSIAGKVQIDPIFGIVAPVAGEVRYLDVQPTDEPVSRPTWVASVWKGDQRFEVKIPKDSTFAGRLLDDHGRVTKGMPVVSAKHSGYGIVAEIASDQAYRLADAVDGIQAQIKNGPGPFPCTPLGAIAALPAGTLPGEEPEPEPEPQTSGTAAPVAPVAPQEPAEPEPVPGSEATGLQLVCAAPANVTMINGVEVTLNVVTGKAENAMVLPVEAVAGSQGKGKVDVVGADKQRRTVDVVLGLTDGKVVEIKSGLQGEETVAVPGPNLPAAEQPTDGASGVPQ